MMMICRPALAAIVLLMAVWPTIASGEAFVKFTGVEGPVNDSRHRGWAMATSWSPEMPPGQGCSFGLINCLRNNGHRIDVSFSRQSLSADMEKVLIAGARFNDVTIEDIEHVDTDYSASTLVLNGVTVESVAVLPNAIRMTFAFGHLSHTSSWTESEVLGIRSPRQ